MFYALLVSIAIGSVVGSRVQCDVDYFCDTAYPICCGPSLGLRHYCYRAGGFCCDNTGGVGMLGCDIGTTCCISPSKGLRQCCPKGTTCSGGRCEADQCQRMANQSQCVDNTACGWCCSQGQCQALALTAMCPGVHVASKQSLDKCPDPCTDNTDCDKCRRNPACDWCCSASRCGTRGKTGCDKWSILQSPTPCTACATKGTGVIVVSDETPIDFNFWLFLAVIGCAIICVGFMCAMGVRMAHMRYVRSHRLQTVLELDRDESGVTPLDVAAATSTTYGFSGERVEVPFPMPEVWPEGSDAVQCCVCMERNATVFCSPCGHIAMCLSCSTQVQETHLVQLDAKFRRTRGVGLEIAPPPCVLCRRPMTGLVFLTTFLGAHPGSRRASRNVSPTNAYLATTDVGGMMDADDVPAAAPHDVPAAAALPSVQTSPKAPSPKFVRGRPKVAATAYDLIAAVQPAVMFRPSAETSPTEGAPEVAPNPTTTDVPADAPVPNAEPTLVPTTES